MILRNAVHTNCIMPYREIDYLKHVSRITLVDQEDKNQLRSLFYDGSEKNLDIQFDTLSLQCFLIVYPESVCEYLYFGLATEERHWREHS